MKQETIKLSGYKPSDGTAFTGRPQGEKVRQELRLNECDNEKEKQILFIFPIDTTSINPSFFLGMLYDSYKKLGEEHFREKYKFGFETLEAEVIENLLRNLEDGLRSAKNTSKENYKLLFK